MQRYLSTVWAMLSKYTGEASPLLERLEPLEELEGLEPLDLEAHGQGSEDSIVLVCEVPEEHLSVWARLGTGSV